MNKPITNFKKTIVRAEALITLYESEPDLTELDDLLRSAVVLGMAGCDSYFTHKFCDALVPFLKHHDPSKELLNMLEKAGLNTKMALELSMMERPFRRIRTLLERSLSHLTTQRTSAIDTLFGAVELKGLTGRVHSRARRTNLGKRLNTMADFRNEIVHAAHLNSHSKPKTISLDDVKSRLRDVALFVETCDRIIDEPRV